MSTSTDRPSCCGPAAQPDDVSVREMVRERYAQVAQSQTSCCGPSTDARALTEGLGYTADTLEAVPEAANLGLGCGNPHAIASLKPGEVVIDLGAGAGLDALIAAKAVGPEGRVIGVDMTPEMLESARANAVEMGVHGYVEFREGLIEQLPVVADSVDVIISNCVINLSPDKPAAFREAFRVLKPGGRLAVSDVVLSAPLPEDIRDLAEAYVACVGGASTEAGYLGAIRDAGFVDVEFTRAPAADLLMGDCAAGVVKDAMVAVGIERLATIGETVWSYQVSARKP